MQAVIIIPETEWRQHLARLEKLEQAEAERAAATAAKPDEVLTTAQASAYIGLSVDALLRARRAGRLQGVRLNEKDWGFRRSALDAYPRRYFRATQQAA
ncbi:helix-turn-helix domain-containing protein [Hymenobacter sp. 5414T-23]|uniref:helix-turn-helix domain-containing protein n=1 Tax=Hymenobacter sp. 5414T-23 TaxID=2932252 RepID=UPI001FD238BA|nr:helix-turn-helix domain-containing protein [Hymenobacter sp. 5414T-23]UOQ80987.1 helix-turn-helix domain-containing protein [Hymenobacter sp. 5414T-23]